MTLSSIQICPSIDVSLLKRETNEGAKVLLGSGEGEVPKRADYYWTTNACWTGAGPDGGDAFFNKLPIELQLPFMCDAYSPTFSKNDRIGDTSATNTIPISVNTADYQTNAAGGNIRWHPNNNPWVLPEKDITVTTGTAVGDAWKPSIGSVTASKGLIAGNPSSTNTFTCPKNKCYHSLDTQQYNFKNASDITPLVDELQLCYEPVNVSLDFTKSVSSLFQDNTAPLAAAAAATASRGTAIATWGSPEEAPFTTPLPFSKKDGQTLLAPALRREEAEELATGEAVLNTEAAAPLPAGPCVTC